MSSWKECKLGDVANINPTESLRKGTIAKKIPMDALQPFTKKIPKFDVEQYNGGVKFRNGDTLVARITPSLENGKTSFVDILDENEIGFGSTEFIVLREKEDESDKHFLYYFAMSSEFRDIAIKSMTGSSGRQRVQNEVVFGHEFLIPPLEEQKAIAEVLSSLDDKIDLLHRQNQTLESIAQTLFRQWFIEEAKEEWEVGKLGDILSTIESGIRPKGGIDPELKNGFASIGAESINGIGNFNFKNTKYITEEFFSSLKRGIVDTYDVLIYKDGAYIGKKAMFGNGFPFEKFAINEHVFILRSNEKSNQFFLYFLLEQDELATLNANSAQPGLNQEAMKSFQILIPPYELIEKFGIIAKNIVDKILFNSKQIQTLENLRDTLLPKLLSGEVRVEI